MQHIPLNELALKRGKVESIYPRKTEKNQGFSGALNSYLDF